MQRALCFETVGENSVRCNICRHNCTIDNGERGVCRVRENRDGILYSLTSGLIIAEHIDPIEKKPIYHLLPGSMSYSMASAGCNFHCLHCQNADIAQYNDNGTGRFPGRKISPDELVGRALASGCRSIAYTYTEPTVWFEYALETSEIAAKAGLYNIFVTNGYISSEALQMIAPVLNAANIDLKGFNDDFYRRVCGARLNKVLESIKEYKRLGIWIEITTLVIPGENDDAEQLNGIARFIAEELGSDTPWHISRFFPCHNMRNHPPTPPDSLKLALEAGERFGLRYLYEGNISGGRENTICPFCSDILIERNGYRVARNNIHEGRCNSCGQKIAGIWK